MSEKSSSNIETQAEVPAAPSGGAGKPELVRNKYADKMNRRKRKLPKPIKIGLTLFVIAAIVGGAIYLVNKTKQSATEQSEIQQTSTAMRGMLETYVECNGQTSAKNKVDLGKDIKGEVTDVLVKSGDTVNIGDVLFIVDPKDTRKELDDANSELDDVMRAVDEARSNLNTAQKNVGYLTIKAPFSGKMIPQTNENGDTHKFKVGESLSSGTVLGTLVDDTTMRLPLYFNNAYLDQIKVGMPATVSIPVSMSSVSGTVETIEQVQKVSDDGAVLFRVIIKLNNEGALKKDMVATASIATSQGEIMPAESGKLEYVREEEIKSQATGDISSVGNLDYFRYSAGQTICTLTSDDLHDAVGTAQRSLETAQKNLKDKQDRIAELQKQISDSTVTSPMNGTVTNISVTVGEKLEGTTTPCTVADLSQIVIKAEIPELDIDKVQVGMPASISMNDDSGTQFFGSVESISMQASSNQNSGNGNGGNTITFPAVIAVDSSAAGEEQSHITTINDRFVNIKITTASNSDCVMVPSSAIVYTEQGAAVFAKPAEGQTFENTLPIPEGSDVPPEYVLVPVETGIFDDTNTEILSGIEEGTEVFLAGPIDPYAQYNEGTVVAVG